MDQKHCMEARSGIEGSIITTIMLTVASIVLWRKLWEEKRNNEILVNERGRNYGDNSI